MRAKHVSNAKWYKTSLFSTLVIYCSGTRAGISQVATMAVAVIAPPII